jgi:hypothetical protein
MIMTAVQLLERNGSPSRDEIRYALGGNLCRCTGYSHIVDAVEHAAKKGWMTPLGSGSVMAYLVRDARSRSPYWYGVYLVVSPGGQRRWVRKSTKKRKRSEAKEILDAWQNTADRAAAGNLDQARIREIVLETVERVTGKRTDSPSVSEWLERWIRTEKDAVGVRTMTRYEQIVRDFLRADLAEKTITFVQRKTGSSVQVPVHQDLYDYLVVLPRSDSPKRPVFPRLFNKPGTGKSGLSMAFKREDCVKGWNATHDVKVELQYVPVQDYIGGSKLQTAFASGQGPDIFIISPGDFLRYYNGGVLVDLTSYMEDAAKKDFFPNVTSIGCSNLSASRAAPGSVIRTLS